MGGEKPNAVLKQAVEEGSPPRGRGKDVYSAVLCIFGRITPAWAGKSDRFFYRTVPGEDHPRVGGEKVFEDPIIQRNWGSPPRGRGKDEHRLSALCFLGITPAWAGKSVRPVHKLECSPDHPRVGGEKWGTACRGSQTLGSPPRGRGKATLARPIRPVARITPAWAGKSTACFTASYPSQDHPRVGGEKLNRMWPNRKKWGSPPRGRGKD